MMSVELNQILCKGVCVSICVISGMARKSKVYTGIMRGTIGRWQIKNVRGKIMMWYVWIWIRSVIECFESGYAPVYEGTD